MPRSEQTTIFAADLSPLSLAILVLPGCSIMCVASTVDPLRAANRVAGRNIFGWRLVSADGNAPRTTCGLPVAVSGHFDARLAADVVVVIGGFGTRHESAGPLIAAFRRAARSARAVIGVEAGGWILGHAGLLDGRSATTHWEDFEDFAAAFPDADLRHDRYVVDGPIITTGGAAPTFDLMLHLVRARLGMAAALDVASVFIYDQSRPATDAQPLVSLGRLDGYDPRLAQAIRIMETHIDRPLPISAIARRCGGVSTRTLEKTFMAAIGETPGAYFLRLRLAAARRLVLDTNEPMAVIAERTGFSSASAFSRAYSRAFAQPPATMRRT
ncbi:MAG: GlxA family transcriptional regulator [Rhizobiaceae bacterium]|nr:GlxA family transcriptional regulator [Rhizobiaceae bacterium]MCV0408297.1 GlxA family transcriptional regulator [Rhizobiaceae bacterium]